MKRIDDGDTLINSSKPLIWSMGIACAMIAAAVIAKQYAPVSIVIGPDVEMPALGAVIRLPAKDAFGRPFSTEKDLALVLLPPCASCTLKQFTPKNVAEFANVRNLVLVFRDDKDLFQKRFGDVLDRVRAVEFGQVHGLNPSLFELSPWGLLVNPYGQVEARQKPNEAIRQFLEVDPIE